MRDTRRGLVPRRLLLPLAALLWSGCGAPADVPEDLDTESSFPQQSAALVSTDRCAPAPAAQSTSGDTVYYRYTTHKSWDGAKAECAAMGGRLAVPMSTSDNEAIRSINGGLLVHIGFRQSSGQTQPGSGWLNLEGEVPTYTHWNAGEPNDGDRYENGNQNCGRMWDNGTWDDISCTSSGSPYVCEFGAQPVTCGGGATCGVATDSTYRCQCPAGQRYDVENNACFGGPLAIEVTHLNVPQASSGNVFVNFPLKARVGLKGTGNTNSFVVSYGLMEKPSTPNPTQAELESLRSCVMGGTRVTLPGDGSQKFIDIEGIVPPSAWRERRSEPPTSSSCSTARTSTPPRTTSGSSTTRRRPRRRWARPARRATPRRAWSARAASST